MKIECIKVEQQGNGFVREVYLVDGGTYKFSMIRKEGKFPDRVGILREDPSLPWLYWEYDTESVEVDFRGFGQISIGLAESLIANYQYAIEAAKLIEKQIHTK